MFNRQNAGADSHEKIDYWISYSDLMAGLLLVFILFLISSIFASKHDYEQQKAALERQLEANAQITARLGNMEDQLATSLGFRGEVMKLISEHFDGLDENIIVDKETGALQFGDNVFFNEGRSELLPAGRAMLNTHMPNYLELLLSNPNIRKHIDSIVFEGHTNSNYSGIGDEYLYNLGLSQERAYQAMRHVIASGIADDFNAKELLVASGFSSSRVLYTDAKHSIEDKERSRRLEIRFRLKDEDTMKDLKNLLETNL